MTTTTIRLSDELKARVSKAAKRAGTTSHSFIPEAIAEKTAQAEQRADFDSVAEQCSVFANYLVERGFDFGAFAYSQLADGMLESVSINGEYLVGGKYK